MLKGEIFEEQLLTAEGLALFNNIFMNGENGIIKDYRENFKINYNTNNYEENKLNIIIKSGMVCIQGRLLKEMSETILTVRKNKNKLGCLVIEIDLSKTNEIDLLNQAYYKIIEKEPGEAEVNLKTYDFGLIKNDLNKNTGIYQYELARFFINVNENNVEFLEKKEYLNYESFLKIIKNEIAKVKGETLVGIYPIGSIYLTVANVNPSETLGGTWRRFAEGRTLFGYDQTNNKFNESNKKGGNNSIKIERNHLPSNLMIDKGGAGFGSAITDNTGYTATRNDENGTATAQALEILPSYITVYMWERIK